MEEKFSTFESLGVFKGLIFTKHRNVHTNVNQTQNCTRNIPPASVSFQTKTNNVIKQVEKGNIDQKPNIKNKSGGEKIQYIPLKPCSEMEMKKSEFDIPENDEIIMNKNCDKTFFNNRDDEVVEQCRLKHTERRKENMNKENLLDEEIDAIEREEGNHERVNNKVPSTVADWVNHLPVEGGIFSKERGDEIQDNNSSEGKPSARAELSREASLQSSSSLESILDSRRPDPVEIFLNLGFGGLPGIDTENCRIPKRFLVPSKCKGGDWNEFLKRELIQAQNFECSSLGFRGLSGPSYRRPSAIVANIMEKLRERTVPPTHNRSRFSTVAKMVLNEKSVLNKLTPEFQSVLSPDSRKFLQNQGKKSPEVPRRRIIFGQKSFAFAHDGEFVEVGSSNIEEKTTKDCQSALTTSDVEEPPVYTNPDVLLKLRRSSFQKQKKVDEDTHVDDVFYVVGSEERSTTEPSFNKNDDDNNNNNNNNNSSSNNNNNNNNNNNECSKKAGKIPRRFLSSSNLKGLEENNISEAIRLEVEKEILNLSQKIKNMNSQDLSSVLQQVKNLRSKIDGQKPGEM